MVLIDQNLVGTGYRHPITKMFHHHPHPPARIPILNGVGPACFRKKKKQKCLFINLLTRTNRIKEFWTYVFGNPDGGISKRFDINV